MAQIATAYVEVRPDLSNFAKFLKMGLAGINPTKEINVTADTKGLSAEIQRSVRRIKKPKVEVEVDVDRSALSRITKGLRGFSDKANIGVFGRVFSGVLKGVSSVMESVAETGGKAFEKLGKSMMDAGGALGPLGEGITKLGAGIAGNAASMGNLIGIIAGISAALAIAVPLVGALSFALAGVLAIVIPLVAAVTALIAEFVALGAAISASLLIVPGAVLGAAAAFAPLIAVMDKFQAMFEKTAKAVGPLYEVMERLRNAIFAVISNDFVKTFQRFATNVLPLLFVGIDKVAQAWNKLLLGLFELASVPGVVENVNKALAFGAKLVGLMAEAAAELGPSLLEFASQALPALSKILEQVMGLVRFFGAWLQMMTESDEATYLFGAIANFARQVLILFQQLAPLAGTFMSAMIGPATQFIAVLGSIVTALNSVFATRTGQQQLSNFFTSMNIIVAELGQLFIDSIPSILQFGDLLQQAMTAARPLATSMLKIFTKLLETIMPGLMVFMDQMTKAFSDPGVQSAMMDLGDSISDLLSILADTNAVMAFVQALSIVVDLADGLIRLINKLAGAVNYLAIAYKISTGNIKGAVSDMQGIVDRKLHSVNEGSVQIGKTWQSLGKTGANVFGGAGSNITTFANANAWQTIIDNANAASAAIETMGRNAFDIQQLQNEKKLGREWRAKKSTAAARKATKPKVDFSGLSSTWSSGWNTAIDASTGKISTSAKKSTKKILSNLKPTFKSLNIMDMIKAPSSYNTGKEIARYLAKGITSGKKNVDKATKIIYASNKKYLDAFAKHVIHWSDKSKKYAGAFPKTFADDVKKMTSVKQLDDYMKKRHEYWTEMLDDIVQFKDAVKNALVPEKGLTGIFGYFPTPKEVKARLDQDLAEMKKFTDGIAALQGKGLDPELARMWLTAGISGAGNMVQGLQNATTAEINEISKSYQSINTEAQKVADAQALKWKGVGEDTVRGYIAGIESMQAEVNDTLVTMLSKALAAAQKKLQAKSPSRVYAGLGVDTMAGYVEGVNSMLSETVGTVSDVFGAVTEVPPATLATPQIKPPLAHTGTLGQVALDSTPQFNVRVFIGDRELTDMVRVVAENADSTRARALLAGRRGG